MGFNSGFKGLKEQSFVKNNRGTSLTGDMFISLDGWNI